MKDKKTRKRTLWIGIAILAVLAIAVLGGGWLLGGQRTEAANAAPDTGDVVSAFVGDLASGTSATGQLLPKQEAQLALNGGGRVEQIHVVVGDGVKAGDVLVQVDSDELERAVQTAEQNLAIQEANLAALLAAPNAEDVAAAEASVADAQAQLDDLLAGPSEKELDQAQAVLDSAQAYLDDLLAGPSEKELAQAQAALDSALASLAAAEARTAALDDQLVVAQNDIHSAQLNLDRARDAYEQLIWREWIAADSWGPYSPQGVALTKAEISYDWAVANYTLTALDANDSALRSAEAQVAQARATLAALTEGQTVQIASARAQVARAEKDLAALTEDKTVQIASARAQLAQAEANLAQLLDGPSEEQIVIAQVAVEQAHIQLADAQADLEDAALVAPFDGLVTDVYVAIGEQASGAAVELVNMDSMQVVVDVDEVDLDEVEVGQEVTVELEAWPDREFGGRVASIAPRAKNVDGIVSYEVRLDVDWDSALDAGEVSLLTGMTADADLITSKRTDVLLVANKAITADRETGTYTVYRVEGDEVVKGEVTIGLRDASYTEITSGLHEGDELVIGYGQADAEDEGIRLQFGGGRGPLAGGRGG
jgi:HlyD family secretion protein